MPSGNNAPCWTRKIVMKKQRVTGFFPCALTREFRHNRLTLAHSEMNTTHYIHFYEINMNCCEIGSHPAWTIFLLGG